MEDRDRRPGISDEELRRLKAIVSPVAERYGVERMWLFGSRARGDARPDSDYDFLISKGKIRSLLTHAALINALEDAIGTKVDVVMDTNGDQGFLEEARKDEVLLYG